jgi:sirohydrochlorin ferrochelatase
MKQALLIVDHGSVRAESNEMLSDVARKLKELCPGVPVHFAHMELAEPTIAQGFEKCVAEGAEEVVVHPYMLGPGRHATKDIPRMVAECAGKFPGVKYRVTPPLGMDRKICEVVLERAGMA